MVIEGFSGDGATILQTKPASSTAFTVVLPKAAMRVFFCSNAGKFLYKESIPEGLKNTKIS